MTTPLHVRVFHCAAELVGGQGCLSDRLGVSPEELSRWMSNQEAPPLLAFFDGLKIVLASEQGFATVFPHRSHAKLVS